MSTRTQNLGLFKYDTTIDSALPFSIDDALNDNWDILDTKAGSPETVVDGTTWYRRFTDGWKEQGGEVSLSETERDWVQPTITSNGTMGGSTFACYSNTANTSYPAFYSFDNNEYTNMRLEVGRYLIFYNPTQLKVSSFTCIIARHGNVSGNQCVATNISVAACNDNLSYVDIANPTFSGSTGAGTTITYSVNSPDYYNYYKLTINNTNVYDFRFDTMSITATYKTSVANSITFPVAFSNTNYSYTFACQDGGGLDAYVNNKTITGMTLSNTNSGSASWTACGY